ncbi:MAG: hypothetical protein Ct9H300mP23_01920 [Nitrospinota bacterium]|nr:MAG: hypothetical protein Ct9H300mP23_01920 [Nitrospinota bacterium]
MERHVKKHKLPGGSKRVTNDPMEATYIGIKMWAQAAEQAGTTNVDAVRQAIGAKQFNRLLAIKLRWTQQTIIYINQ